MGIDENDNTGVAQFFHHWTKALGDAGVQHDFIAHHTGRATNARSRGASRLDDEPDAVWTLTKLDTSDDDPDMMFVDSAPRSLRAYGRDVELPGITLAFDTATGILVDSGEKPHIAVETRRENATRSMLIEWVATAGAEGRQYSAFTQSKAKGGPGGANSNSDLYSTIRDELIRDGVFTKVQVGSGYRVHLASTMPPNTTNTPDYPSVPLGVTGVVTPHPYKGG